MLSFHLNTVITVYVPGEDPCMQKCIITPWSEPQCCFTKILLSTPMEILLYFYF